MSAHADCIRATLKIEHTDDGREQWTWTCCRCGTFLGLGSPDAGALLDPRLKPMNDHRDGLPAFGLPKRDLVGKGASGKAWGHQILERRFVKVAELRPIYVYCPEAGVCGKGQHLHTVLHS